MKEQKKKPSEPRPNDRGVNHNRRLLPPDAKGKQEVQSLEEAFPASLSTGSAGASLPYRPAIDGMRALAVLAVFVFHLKHELLPGGFAGVDVFFVISGYLITSILMREYQDKSFSLWKFYQRRIARLFPAFLTVALSTFIAAHFLYSSQDLSYCGAMMKDSALSLTNVCLIRQEGNYFSLVQDAEPFLHCWSLSVEEQFYLFFPAGFLLLYLKAKRFLPESFAVVLVTSFLVCFALTYTWPVLAFYSLPSRAWEFLAGGILVVLHIPRWSEDLELRARLALTGLVLIVVSFVLIHENMRFPGYAAIFPVAGAALILGPSRNSAKGVTEKVLSWGALVVIGRMSYSLYLWHWPIFCFVDYRLYSASPLVRLALKIGLSFALTALCYCLIERPARVFFNLPQHRQLSFVFLTCALLVIVPLGVSTQWNYYLSSSLSKVASGGLIFNSSATNGSMILMGDSYASMYGTMIRDVAEQMGLKLNLISVDGQEELPGTTGHSVRVLNDSLSFVKRDKSDFIIIAQRWQLFLGDDPTNLKLAIQELKPYTRCIILITQPPYLPDQATRLSMRMGARPPFYEDSISLSERKKSNAMVRSFQGAGIVVIDAEPHFLSSDGSVRFADASGRFLYQDQGHLSGLGAELIKADLMKVLVSQMEEKAATHH